MSHPLNDACRSPLTQSAADFLHYLQSQRRLSAHTIAAYRRDIDKLLTAAAENGETIPDNCSIAHLAGSGQSPRIKARLACPSFVGVAHVF